MTKKFKAGDKVIIRSGKDKGREGTIESIDSKLDTALIPGVNMYKKHVKKQLTRDGKGGIFDIPRPMALSKLSLVDPKTGKPTRVGFELKNGKKLRIAKKSGVQLDKKKVTKNKK